MVESIYSQRYGQEKVRNIVNLLANIVAVSYVDDRSYEACRAKKSCIGRTERRNK